MFTCWLIYLEKTDRICNLDIKKKKSLCLKAKAVQVSKIVNNGSYDQTAKWGSLKLGKLQQFKYKIPRKL